MTYSGRSYWSPSARVDAFCGVAGLKFIKIKWGGRSVLSGAAYVVLTYWISQQKIRRKQISIGTFRRGSSTVESVQWHLPRNYAGTRALQEQDLKSTWHVPIGFRICERRKAAWLCRLCSVLDGLSFLTPLMESKGMDTKNRDRVWLEYACLSVENGPAAVFTTCQAKRPAVFLALGASCSHEEDVDNSAPDFRRW